MEGESSRDEIEEFVKLTNSTREQAQFFLEASGGDFDSAVIMYMGMPLAVAVLHGKHQGSGNCKITPLSTKY